MTINDIQLTASLHDVLSELKYQLHLNGFKYFEKEFRDVGEDIMVQCPYHGNGQERKPSAGIRKKDGMFHCFACNETHSLPEVISYCFGYNDILGKQGLKWIVKNFATVQVEERKDVDLDFSRKAGRKYDTLDNRALLDSKDNNYVTEEELDSYRYYHKYWKKRGIVDENIIELFDLGYDSSNKAITFPVKDISGNCVFVARRSVVTKFFNYPKGAEKPLYGLYELHKQAYDIGYHPDEVFVCESMIDCLLLWQAGFYAVALNGLGNDLQFVQLSQLLCRKLILATDNDSAGKKARERIKKYVKRKFFTEIDFPEGIKDIGECTQEQIKNIKDWEVF